MQDSSSRLGALQSELLSAFFERSDRFFLSGGAALAGFYLHHRTTNDLDLFATPDVELDEGVRALRAAAASLPATVESLRLSPDFARFAVSRGAELTLVDLVIDRAPQLFVDKPRRGRIRLDSLEEIGANKVCALLGRTAPRDLFDLSCILAAGFDLATLVADAARKEGGVDAATLAWVLGELRIAKAAALPPETSHEALEAIRLQLVGQLLRIALPPSS